MSQTRNSHRNQSSNSQRNGQNPRGRSLRNKSNSSKNKRRFKRGKRERQIELIRKVSITVLILCLILLGVVMVQGLHGRQTNLTVNQLSENEELSEGIITPEAVADVKLTVSAVGDCTLGSDEDFDEDSTLNTMYNRTGDPSYFFRNAKNILAADDLTIANLEGPLTKSEDIQEKEFSFKGQPEYIQILTQGSVEAVNLANNHSYDYGEEGYQDTIANAENAGIASFGYEQTALLDIKGIKVGMAGIYVLADGMEREAQVKEHINALKQQGAQLIIVSFHWGNEREEYPDKTQINLGHTAVDSGADLVVGHHPHVLQGIEKYQGKYIVYSLANFCFGGNSNPSDKDTMIFQQTFTIRNGKNVTGDDIKILPCSISSVNDYNNYQPSLTEGQEKERIMKKIEERSNGIASQESSNLVFPIANQ